MFRRRKRTDSAGDPAPVTAETIARERERGMLSRVTVVPRAVITPASMPTFWIPRGETTATPPVATSLSAPQSAHPVPRVRTPADDPGGISPVDRAARAARAAPENAAITAAATPVDSDVELTTHIPRRYALELPDGRLVPLDEPHTVIGRASHTAPPGQAGTSVIGIVDPTRSLSRSHARVDTDASGRLSVHDLDSGNGTVVVSARTGHVHECIPGTPVPLAAGDVLSLGHHEIRVRRHRG